MSQKVLVAGSGISGIAAAKLLLAQGGEVVLYDGNTELSAEDLKKKFDKDAKVTVLLGELKKTDLSGVELCVISPGIPLDAPFVAVLDEAKIPGSGSGNNSKIGRSGSGRQKAGRPAGDGNDKPAKSFQQRAGCFQLFQCERGEQGRADGDRLQRRIPAHGFFDADAGAGDER